MKELNDEMMIATDDFLNSLNILLCIKYLMRPGSILQLKPEHITIDKINSNVAITGVPEKTYLHYNIISNSVESHVIEALEFLVILANRRFDKYKCSPFLFQNGLATSGVTSHMDLNFKNFLAQKLFLEMNTCAKQNILIYSDIF